MDFILYGICIILLEMHFQLYVFLAKVGNTLPTLLTSEFLYVILLPIKCGGVE